MEGVIHMATDLTPVVDQFTSVLSKAVAKSIRFDRIAFVASESEEAIVAQHRFVERYGNVLPDRADVIVALGGDGLMLNTLRRHLNDEIPVYGMNRGSIGFLMNEYRERELHERLQRAEISCIHPLRMVAHDRSGSIHEALAINEVSLFRQTHQAAKLRISIDGRIRLDELICDGVLVTTPAGSTAYNLSVSGPILPMDAPLLALTPISPFRPRRWRGAILPNIVRIRIEVLEPDKRPVSVVADDQEIRDILEVAICEMNAIKTLLLFDSGHALDERILSEQFRCCDEAIA